MEKMGKWNEDLGRREVVLESDEGLGVTAYNRNGPGQQSRRVRDYIHCSYRHLQDRIRCD
jgi:hypothetical protein